MFKILIIKSVLKDSNIVYKQIALSNLDFSIMMFSKFVKID